MSLFLSFVYFSCQFVVKDGQDYSVHLMDPDVLVKWESVEQVVSPFLQMDNSSTVDVLKFRKLVKDFPRPIWSRIQAPSHFKNKLNFPKIEKNIQIFCNNKNPNLKILDFASHLYLLPPNSPE